MYRGAFAYLTKPVDLEELLRTLSEAMERGGQS
jgi:DNA-binding NtrC family response regulator